MLDSPKTLPRVRFRQIVDADVNDVVELLTRGFAPRRARACHQASDPYPIGDAHGETRRARECRTTSGYAVDWLREPWLREPWLREPWLREPRARACLERTECAD